MTISIGTIKPGTAILYNNELYTVVSREHAKLARGSAFCRAKLKHFKTGQITDCTLRDSDKIDEAFIEKRRLQYLYSGGEIYHFLDMETYEDIVLDKPTIGNNVMWLKDNLELLGLFYNNELQNLEFPASLELKVVNTTPGVKGDTVKMATKEAKLETGLVIQTPLFINVGEIIKVDTRTKEYLGRA